MTHTNLGVLNSLWENTSIVFYSDSTQRTIFFDADEISSQTFDTDSLSTNKLSIKDSISGNVNVSGNVKFTALDGTSNRYAIGTSSSSYNYDVAYINSKAISSSGTYHITVNGKWETNNFSSHNIVSSASDIRLKENIKNTKIKNAIEFINNIKIREFDWKHSKTHQKIGFIADELEKLDSALSIGGGYETDGTPNYKTVNGFYLQGYEVKAIQELSSELNHIKQEFENLKKTITNL